MSTTPPPRNSADLAARVIGKLDTHRGELDADVNPHRMALRNLGMKSAFSGTEVPYSDKAFLVWNELRQRNAADWETVHHLAIMHHARAMDLECGKYPARSDADWIEAMELWHQLWGADAFWERRAAGTSRTIAPQVWTALRERLPSLLLSIHYDIALDMSVAKVDRATFHLRLVRESPYSLEIKQAVPRDAYTRFVSVVPNAVWQFQETSVKTIKEGIDRIELFLALEPGCVPALEDALRLEARLLNTWATDLQAVGADEGKRKQLLQTIRQAADHWRPHFDQMAEIPDLDEEIRQKLGRWYRLMGDVKCGLGQLEVSLLFYEQGTRSTHPDDDEHRRCAAELVETQALIARELASEGKPNARNYCDKVRARTDLTIKAHFILANAYVLLKEFDAAQAICERGLAVEPELSDIDEIEKNARDRERLEEMRRHTKDGRRIAEARSFLDQAVELIKGNRENEALAVFEQAEALAPDLGLIYFLRAQCHLTLGHVEAAQADLVSFARADNSDDAKQAYAKLQKSADHIEQQVAKFGSDGFKLRRQAVAAANAEDFSRAADLLALAQCQPAGKAEIQKALATVLINGAIKSVNAAMGSMLQTPTEKKTACREALAALQEAARHDPANQRTRKAFRDLQKVIASLDHTTAGASALSSRLTQEVLAVLTDEQARRINDLVRRRK